MIQGFLPRVLGDLRSSDPGPTLVVVCAIHGNEPAGVIAAQAVMPALAAMGLRRGRVVALVGNRAAVVRGARGQMRDLNREFTPERVAILHAQPESADDPEQIEARALLACIDDLAAASDRPLVLLDMHTTSGGGPPFSVVPDALTSRELAMALPFPAILGLLESIRGTLLSRMTAQGHVGLGIETGQHTDPFAADLHAAAMWRLMRHMGLISREPPSAKAALDAVDADLPAVVEQAHRHEIQPGDDFKMRPGFCGFQRVYEGQPLADSARGPIRSPMTGRILMPLYQAQGDDGFFIIKDVSRRWLWATSALRRVGADRMLGLLPGVQRAGPDTVQIPPHPSDALQKGLRFFGYRRQHDGVAQRAREPRAAPWRT
ncbi:MAG: putative deacylase [Bradymonadia bacterium]|jgi:predicted deacylase